MATSFKKKTTSSRPVHPRGTRPSLHNAQLLVSSGVPSLDVLLGGGLAVGTVLLIEEDCFGSYSRLLLKYFLAEGVMCGHSCFVASASERPTDILQDLPGSLDDSQARDSAPKEGTDEQMKIAWRYQNVPKVQSSFSNRFGHFFDLTSSMEPTRLQTVETSFFPATDQPAKSCEELYASLRTSIQEAIISGQFSVDDTTAQQRNVLRVTLHSLGSPLWLDDPGSPDPAPFLSRFLHSLRALLRRAYAVAVITMPTHLMPDAGYVRRLERLCDAAVRVESFAGSEKEQNPLYKEYHGLFHLVKLPRLNSLASYLPETLDLAFKLRRKKFSIEKLHLPPELSDSASRPQEEEEEERVRAGSKHLHPARGGVVLEQPPSRTHTGGRQQQARSVHSIDF